MTEIQALSERGTSSRSYPRTVLILGSFDTKGEELDYLRGRLEDEGLSTLTLDFGVGRGTRPHTDITSDVVATEAGTSLQELRDQNDRSAALAAMTAGAIAIVKSLLAEQKIDGAVSLGGGGGTRVSSEAMQVLPSDFLSSWYPLSRAATYGPTSRAPISR